MKEVHDSSSPVAEVPRVPTFLATVGKDPPSAGTLGSADTKGSHRDTAS